MINNINTIIKDFDFNRDKLFFLSFIMIFFIITIIIVVLIYAFYMLRLSKSQCNYMNSLYPKINGNLRSVSEKDPSCKYTLKDYYIKTAYNCCNGGSYRNDFVSVCPLKSVINEGVRCLDFELYSIKDQPVIASSVDDSYYIKETYNYVRFSDFMNVVVNYAFSNSTCPNPNDPLIFHMRIKSKNQSMYNNLSKIIKNYSKYFLGSVYSFEYNKYNLGDVPLLQLKNKIIIIVDRKNTSYIENKNFWEYVNITSNSIFMRALSYYDIAYNPDFDELKQYNKRNMTIGMPDKFSNPENPNCIVLREAGCQMLAMRYQYVDSYLEESTNFFNRGGYAFVLKPESLRYKPVLIPEIKPQNPSVDYLTRTIQTDFYKVQI